MPRVRGDWPGARSPGGDLRVRTLQRTPHEAELWAEWVRVYRKARRRGLPPEEASRVAEAEVWGFEELPL